MNTTAVLSLPDAAALAWFFLLIGGYRIVAEFRNIKSRSISGAVQVQRVRWMRTMAQRDARLMDAILLGHLSQGNAFFASTCAIAIGGLVTLLGRGDSAMAALQELPYVAHSTPISWTVKVILLISIFAYAFFKFAWAFRLSHYTAILIGATPLLEAGDDAACLRHADAIAELNGIAAEHANAGLRSFFYSIAAMAWFFHPLLFIAATAAVVLILVRRDFFSRSRNILASCDFP
ncbi:MAG: DUF599 domain-containing protein [Hyphomicrobium sp.]